MTPIEIFEYKKRWQRGDCYKVRLHSDLRRQGKDYCKTQMMPQQWDVSEFTDVYEDTFYFEYKQDAQCFASKWPEYVNQ